jgi:hypothetical protein
VRLGGTATSYAIPSGAGCKDVGLRSRAMKNATDAAVHGAASYSGAVIYLPNTADLTFADCVAVTESSARAISRTTVLAK